MKTNVVTRITIDARPAQVFEYLTNLRYIHLWNPQVTKVSSHKKLKLHSTYSTTSNVLGITVRAKNTVTGFEQDKLFRVENNTGLVHYVASFDLNRKGRKTLVKCQISLSADAKAFAFARPVLKMLARRELQTDLQGLKLAVEHKLLQ